MSNFKQKHFAIDFCTIDLFSVLNPGLYVLKIYFQDTLSQIQISISKSFQKKINLMKLLKFQSEVENPVILIILSTVINDQNTTIGEARLKVKDSLQNIVNTIKLSRYNHLLGSLAFRFSWLEGNEETLFDRQLTLLKMQFDLPLNFEKGQLAFQIFCDQKMINLTSGFNLDSSRKCILFHEIKLKLTFQSKVEIVVWQTGEQLNKGCIEIKQSKIDEQVDFLFKSSLEVTSEFPELGSVFNLPIIDNFANEVGLFFFKCEKTSATITDCPLKSVNPQEFELFPGRSSGSNIRPNLVEKNPKFKPGVPKETQESYFTLHKSVKPKNFEIKNRRSYSKSKLENFKPNLSQPYNTLSKQMSECNLKYSKDHLLLPKISQTQVKLDQQRLEEASLEAKRSPITNNLSKMLKSVTKLNSSLGNHTLYRFSENLRQFPSESEL